MTRTFTKEEKLEAFLTALPDKYARQLLAACDSADTPDSGRLPFALMRTALARRADMTAERVFGAAMPLTSEEETAKSPGRIAKSSILPVAQWAARVAPDAYEAASEGLMPGLGRRAALGRALQSAVKKAGDDGRKLPHGRRVREDLEDLIAILCAEPDLSEGLEVFPPRIEDFDEGCVSRARDFYEALAARDSAAGMLALFLLMARLERPSQILRVLRKMAGRNNDVLATQTDVSVIGDRLLDDASDAVARMDPPVHGAPDGPMIVRSVRSFAGISRGMTRELGIRRDGKWGRRLQDLRTRAARTMEELCVAAPDAIVAGLPITRVRLASGAPAMRPAIEAPPRAQVAERARSYAVILGGVRDYASSCAFGAAHSKAFEDAERSLDDYCSSLIDTIRDGDEAERAAAGPWLDLAADITCALIGEDAAAVLRRRALAAAAASDEPDAEVA